jgi:hypothetical protein
MPRWSAVVKRETGEPVSFCTAGKEAPTAVLEAKGLEVVDLGEHPEGGPDQRTQRWDPATRRFVARVVKDRLEDLQTSEDPVYVAFRQAWASLNATQRTAIRAALVKLLGPLRQRQDDEPIELG